MKKSMTPFTLGIATMAWAMIVFDIPDATLFYTYLVGGGLAFIGMMMPSRDTDPPDFRSGPLGVYMKPIGSHEDNPFDPPERADIADEWNPK